MTKKEEKNSNVFDRRLPNFLFDFYLLLASIRFWFVLFFAKGRTKGDRRIGEREEKASKTKAGSNCIMKCNFLAVESCLGRTEHSRRE